ncbi:MAG: T9SS type A sorting domain-containing protein [bacterium]|nr:T9SS type A sorting domain-containing protein [bacterium]
MKVLLLSILSLSCLYLNGQHTLDWAYTLNHATGSSSSIGVCTDFEGNIITGGVYLGEIDADPGAAIQTLTASDEHLLIQKLDDAGNLIWAKECEGNVADFSVYIDSDATGNIVIAGKFSGSLDADPGPGSVLLNTSSSSAWDAFVIKLDKDGNYLWSRQFETGGQSNDIRISQIATGISDEVYVTGDFSGMVQFGFDGTLLTSSSQSHFVIRMAANGTQDWINTYGNNGNNEGQNLSIRANGNLLVSMSFGGIMTLDQNVQVGATGVKNGLLLELDPNGNYVNNTVLRGQIVYLKDAQEDAYQNVYLSGFFNGEIDLNPGVGINEYFSEGYFDAFVLKLVGDSVAWKFTLSSLVDSSSMVSEVVMPWDLEFDSYNNAYIGGAFSGAVDFDPGPDSAIITSPVQTTINEAFLLQLAPDGSYLWSASLPTGFSSSYYNLVLNDNNDLICTGTFRQSVDLDPGIDTLAFQFVNESIFIQKLNPPAILSVPKQNVSTTAVRPNPSDGVVYLTFEKYQELIEYEVFTSEGRLADNGTFQNGSEAQLHLPERTGLYFLKLRFGNRKELHRIIRK